MNLNDFSLKVDKLNENMDEGLKLLRALVQQQQIANLLAFSVNPEIEPVIANHCANEALNMMQKTGAIKIDDFSLKAEDLPPVFK